MKVFYSPNVKSSANEVVILPFLCSNLHIAFSKWKVFWFYFSYSNFPLLTECPYVKVI